METTNVQRLFRVRIGLVALAAALLAAIAPSCGGATTGDGSVSHFGRCRTDHDCPGTVCSAGYCTSERVIRDGSTDVEVTFPARREASVDLRPSPEASVTQPESCIVENTSTIPHVHVEFPSHTCAFTIQQAAAGITIPYTIVIDEDVPGYTTRFDASPVLFYAPGYGDTTGTAVGNFQVAALIEGGNLRYCLCDQGPPAWFCQLQDGGPGGPQPLLLPDGGVRYPSPLDDNYCAPVTLEKATYSRSFTWDGRSWDGPSDTVNPEGAPFPPGDYALKIGIYGRLAGDGGSKDVAVDAQFLVRLVP